MKKKYEKKLSIIIPHFNTPYLLEKLIISIPENKEIQIVVVDDNSNVQLDKLNHIQNQYCHRVSFYKNDSAAKGAGACRNIGLSHANGEWLLFADADDFYVDGMYDTVSVYFDLDYDMVFFTPTSIYLDSGKPCNRHDAYEKRINNYLKNPSRQNLLKIKYAPNAPWASMVRHNLIQNNNIKFDEVLFYNDIMFAAKAGYYSNKIAVSKETIYCITKSRGSLTTHTEWNAYEIRLHEYLKVCRFIKKHCNKEDFDSLDCTGFGMICTALRQRYGIKKLLYIFRLFRKSGIPLFSLKQLNLELLTQLIKNCKSIRQESKYNTNESLNR